MTNLAELLKDAPNDLILYSVIFGDCKINVQKPYIHCCSTLDQIHFTLNEFGQMAACNQENTQGECLLFPDTFHRTWDNWVKPWEDKEPKYDFEPFQKVLVRDHEDEVWRCNIFSHIDPKNKEYKFACVAGTWRYCIPYNEHTKHLVGTTVQFDIGEFLRLINPMEGVKYNIEIRKINEDTYKLQFIKALKDAYPISLKEAKNVADVIFGIPGSDDCVKSPYVLPFDAIPLNEAQSLVLQLREIGVEAKFILIFNS